MYQGRQQHQWFGHGTAPKEAREEAEPPGSDDLFDRANIGQRIDYAVSHVIAEAPRGERSRWENRLNGAARNSIKAVLGAWYGARSMSRDAFRQRLLDPYTSDETVDQLRAAAKTVVEARISSQLGEAGSALGSAVFKIGVDAWPRYLGDAERRAITAASDRAIPGVIRASSDGMDVPRAIGTAIVLGGIILYLRHQQEEAARQAGSKPTASQASPQLPIISPATPRRDAKDPDGAKAPGKPGAEQGFKDPKGSENWVPNPNGRGYGWLDANGDVWVPSGQGGDAHGGPYWDVQSPGGGYRNVRPPKKETQR